MAKKAILIVLDSAGVGAMPDAHLFGDTGSDTVGHIIEKRGLNVPNMRSLGLFNIEGTSFNQPERECIGCFGKAAEKTHAKDTTCGHWEMAGIIMETPFKTFPDGFTKEIIDEFEEKANVKTIGNCVASGTEIIQRLGDEHVKTGYPIIYTSADSVFQVAAHEGVVPLTKLYEYCEIARRMLVGKNAVGRVIAHPFIGEPGNYTRTENRKDYALDPPEDTILDGIIEAGKNVYGIGKIEDIFCHRGINKVNHTKNNVAGIQATIDAIKEDMNGLIFTNLVDFDMLHGHRNDIQGYGDALEYFDRQLPDIMANMSPEDLLMITADHGCDPGFPGTDHTREYIPLLIYGKNLARNVDIGTRATFADIGATVYDFLGFGQWKSGQSFLHQIAKSC